MRGMDGGRAVPTQIPEKWLGPGMQEWLGILCAMSPGTMLSSLPQCFLLRRLGLF